MLNSKKETYLTILFLFSFTILLIAYAIQYILGYQPCNLCIVERIPYALTLIILILYYFTKKDLLFYSVLLMLIFTFSFLISAYHLGIEQGLIKESNICEAKNIELIEKEELLKSFEKINVSCKDVTFKIFDLSLTTYNMIISIFMFLISTKIYLISNGFKK